LGFRNIAKLTKPQSKATPKKILSIELSSYTLITAAQNDKRDIAKNKYALSDGFCIFISLIPLARLLYQAGVLSSKQKSLAVSG
jgi:hypothetical protein